MLISAVIGTHLLLIALAIGIYLLYVRRYSYFVHYEIETLEEKNFNKKVARFVKKFFFLRGGVTRFFEPFTPPRQHYTHLIFGTAPVDRGGRMNRNAFIFIMELYAQFEDPEVFQVDQKIKHTIRNVDGVELHIYRIPKNGSYEES